MDIRRLHDWDVSPAEAVRLQEALQGQAVLASCPGEVHAIAVPGEIHFALR